MPRSGAPLLKPSEKLEKTQLQFVYCLQYLQAGSVLQIAPQLMYLDQD